VVCDELAFYLAAEDRKQRAEFAELLRDLVARGRAAGIIVVAATQKPASDVVPSALRDLFGFRLALRCNTPQASDTILGQGWASAGYSAATIPPGQRGVGYLLAEDGLPVRIRAFHLPDEQITAIAERASALRADAWLAAGAQERVS
jgi:DNA segregation ATPase FtsK/SpoIIIE, S-DNA-T family